jgi:hypothetical protein
MKEVQEKLLPGSAFATPWNPSFKKEGIGVLGFEGV